MKLPDWITVGRIPRTNNRTITVELTADISRFLAGAEHAAEGFRRASHQLRISHERTLGRTYINQQLDQLCRDFGLDPLQVWRIPRAREQRDRDADARVARALAEFRLAARARDQVAAAQRAGRFITDVTS